jgi:hypothetical protein
MNKKVLIDSNKLGMTLIVMPAIYLIAWLSISVLFSIKNPVFIFVSFIAFIPIAFFSLHYISVYNAIKGVCSQKLKPCKNLINSKVKAAFSVWVLISSISTLWGVIGFAIGCFLAIWVSFFVFTLLRAKEFFFIVNELDAYKAVVSEHEDIVVQKFNPGSGMPMSDSLFDVAGNPYGSNIEP